MKKNFDDLTDQEKFDLVEAYLSTKQQITGMDIATCISMLGSAGSIWVHTLSDVEFFKFVPLSLVPIFVFMAYKKVKLSKRYKKVTNGKVNYAKIRKTELNGQLDELVATYSIGEQARRVSENLGRLLGLNVKKDIIKEEKKEETEPMVSQEVKVETQENINKEIKTDSQEKIAEENENK